MRAPFLLLWLVAALAVTALPSPSAHARPGKRERAEAERLTADAVARFKAKAYDEAARLFMQAYELAREPTSVFNAARAKEDGGRLGEARALYELYLRIGTSPEGVVDARRRIEAIDARVEAERQARQAEADKAKADAEAAQARAAAEAAAAARAKADAAAAQAAARAAATEAAADQRARTLAILPPSLADGAARGVAERLLVQVAAEAGAAGLGPIRSDADVRAAVAARGAAAGRCDHACLLDTAAAMGASHAVAISAWNEGGVVRLRIALWQTADARDAGSVHLQGPGLEAALRRHGSRLLGDLFNELRWWTPLPGGAPAAADGASVTIETEPATARVEIDGARVVGPLVRRAPGMAIISVTAPGHHRRVGRIRLRAGQGVRIHVALPTELRAGGAGESPPDAGAAAPGTGAGPPARPAVPPRPTTATPRAQAQVEERPAPAAAQPTRPEERPALPQTPPPTSRQTPTPTPTPTPTQPEDETFGAAPANGFGVRPAPSGGLGMRRRQAPERGAKVPEPTRSVTGGVVVRGGLGAMLLPGGDIGTQGAAGAFGHIGFGPDGEVPYLALTLGIDGFGESGAATPNREALRGMGLWGGVALPRAGGLLLGFHHYDVSDVAGVDAFAFRTLSLRKLFGSPRFFIAFGLEVRIDSDREIDDRLGGGPIAGAMVELGVGLGGRGLTR
ncbi:MAG: hypothetical protein RIT45_2798 [Pseudomonadota bacterium]